MPTRKRFYERKGWFVSGWDYNFFPTIQPDQFKSGPFRTHARALTCFDVHRYRGGCRRLQLYQRVLNEGEVAKD